MMCNTRRDSEGWDAFCPNNSVAATPPTAAALPSRKSLREIALKSIDRDPLSRRSQCISGLVFDSAGGGNAVSSVRGGIIDENRIPQHGQMTVRTAYLRKQPVPLTVAGPGEVKRLLILSDDSGGERETIRAVRENLHFQAGASDHAHINGNLRTSRSGQCISHIRARLARNIRWHFQNAVA
jgi:hypothetical protein